MCYRACCARCAGSDGELRPELRAGVAPPSDAERDVVGGASLRRGGDLLGRRAPDGAARGRGVLRAHGLCDLARRERDQVGEPRTIVPAVARAHLSLRLAPGQSAQPRCGAELERMLRAAAPPGAEVAMEMSAGRSGAVRSGSIRRSRLAAEAMERACGTPSPRVRLGGTLPVLAALADARDRHRGERLRPGRRRLPRSQRELPPGEPAPRRGVPRARSTPRWRPCPRSR